MRGEGYAGVAVLCVPAAIMEKESRLAEPWHRRHQQLHLNTQRDLSALPGLAYPGDAPAFPHRNIVIRHMNDFKEANRLPVEFGVAV